MTETIHEIEKLHDQLQKLKSPFKQLFIEKLEELKNRRNLIVAYSKQDFENIAIYNKKLFGDFNEELLQIAKEKVFSLKEDNQKLLGEPLTLSEIEKTIEKYLADKKIYGVDIVFSYTNISRISVIMGKQIKISVAKHWIFREKELLSILAHEIDTHLIRHLNGIKSWWNILKSGTGNHIQDEEWLAIYNASKILPEWYEKISIYKEYFLTHQLQNNSFVKSFELCRFLYPTKSMEKLFKTVLRNKRGLIHTWQNKWIWFQKDKVYLDGFSKIHNRIQAGNNPEKMYKGKIKIEDLDYIK